MNLLDLDLNGLIDFFDNLDQPAYRAKQIYKRLYRPPCDFQEITEFPKQLRQQLDQLAHSRLPKVIKTLNSKDNETVKLLCAFEDGEMAECVIMRYHDHCSVCVSTQVGCGMGCVFCASGVGGFTRNMTVSEMMGQVLLARNVAPVSHVVLMGTGEPLCNLDNVLVFMENLRQGLGISARNITLSTCGIVSGIQQLAEQRLPITLAVSLHAPNDSIRQKIIPSSTGTAIKELVRACHDYFLTTGRRVTYSYTLIREVNDTIECAEQLAQLIPGGHVNLIPLNATNCKEFKRPSKKSIYNFQNVLKGRGLKATVRRELGTDVNAACGQLRNSADSTNLVNQPTKT